MRKWRIEDSRDLYNINGWGIGYFDINEKGHATVSPLKDKGPQIDLSDVMLDLQIRDLATPVLLRFPDILDHRIEQISQCFESAAHEYGYQGKYYNVYPIKVNQQRPVLEEVVRHGKKFNIGLEAGSKPELHAVLAVQDNPESLIICNGYKDEDFIELALLAQKMGKRIYLVVEKLPELALIARLARQINVRPNIGMRIKLASFGSGKWEESGGYQSKFGLNASDLIEAINLVRAEGLEDCVKLIHFHLGSQITNIRKIKAGLREVAQFYCQLNRMGFGVEFVDVGGGLGVDYDGTRSTSASSVNYSIQEYANDVLYSIVEACAKHGLAHPNVIAESGRALTAHHSVLVFNVLETASQAFWNEDTHHIDDDDPAELKDLQGIYHNLTNSNMLESWHDALQLHEDVLDKFNFGDVDLPTRANAERLFWGIAQKVDRLAAQMRHPPYELHNLGKMLADKYFCNFSLFQSLPDSWAIDQIFPIMPLQRLEEEPVENVTLQDITCDSDGKIDFFVKQSEIARSLPLHTLKPEEPYFVGVYLVGAYQEILGDLHNLFGDTNAVHIVCRDDKWEIEKIIDGESVADVLEYVQFDDKKLVKDLEAWVTSTVKDGRISAQEGREFLNIYRSGLYGYTYLE
ncbi:MAG TPA: biosynthetic arginine decarboxylase [Fibrobacteraceae bacterium]|nr:biosynthetic arginine decarboxylase [Fibrobacteraceae bacterium]